MIPNIKITKIALLQILFDMERFEMDGLLFYKSDGELKVKLGSIEGEFKRGEGLSDLKLEEHDYHTLITVKHIYKH